MKKRRPLTRVQEQVWGILLRWAEDYGTDFSPTRQEIADEMGVTRQWVDIVLQSLRKKKYVRFIKGRNRNIRIIELKP